MTAPKFASSHNMVAFLDKPTESDGFEQIVDFLNIHPIKYALTVNPTIYTACIEQFCATAKVKTVNGELTLIGAKTTAWNEFSSTMDSAVICLATNQNSTFPLFLDKQFEGMSKHKEIYVTPSHTKKVFANIKRQGKDFSGRDTPLFPTMIVQAQEQVEPVTDNTGNVASVPTNSNDPLLCSEDRLKLNELIELCTSLSQRVLDLEKTKTSQTTEITELKERGRKINEIDQDAEVTLVDETQGRYGDNLMFDTGVPNNEQDMVEKEVDMAEKDVSTADPVTTDSTTTTTVDELTLAQTLIEIKATKPKARGIIVQEPSEFTTTTSPLQPSQLPQAKDKGKAKMVEPKKPLKKKDQIMFDKEVAQKLQAQLDAELEEEEKLARQREKDANIAEWNNV
ncbi:hypothetical protein Tco_1229360 [Tanacetum coccineum]